MKRGMKLPLRAAALILLLAAPAAPVPTETPLPVHVGGRTVRETDGALRFGWPGVWFEGRFRGTEVTVAVESGTEHFRLLVDGEERARLVEPGAARLTFSGLTPGEHVVRLEKLTESQEGGGRFLGFFATNGAEPLPPRPRPRRIEFVGDSYTVGYGNVSRTRQCTRDEVHDTTDTSRAFGPLLAASLDADYRIHAFSGFGIVRNYAGGVPDLSLPAIYDRAIPGDPASAGAAVDAGWRPQLVIVNLGTNDFSTPLRAGERWSDETALRRDYRDSYAAFLRRLRTAQPQARFILMASEHFLADVEQVAAAVDPDRSGRVTVLPFAGLDRDGCDWHPGLADHEALAELLERTVAAMPGVWE
jgi:lysophospholipase L1-like esterase